jgi:hypothetical protein
MNQDGVAGGTGDVLRPQVRLLTIGAVIGAVLLGASLVVDVAGLADPELPRVPRLTPRTPAVPTLPSGIPTLPGGPTDLPSGFPSGFPTELPTGLPSGFPTELPLPPDLPSLPALPGGAR